MHVSNFCERSHAKSLLVCFEPGRIIQSSFLRPAKSLGERAQTNLSPDTFLSGWNSSKLLMRGYAMTATVFVTDPVARLWSSNMPSSSGNPCCHHIGNTATVGIPVNFSNICGAGASKLASPRNLFSTKPFIRA